MPARMPSQSLARTRPNDKLVRAYADEAARLRDLAGNVTTLRLRSRLLEEAANHEQLAEAAKRGMIQPHVFPST